MTCHSFIRCSCPSSTDGRCPMEAMENSYHCPAHIDKAKKLYLRYKRVQELAEDHYQSIINLSPKNIDINEIPLINKVYGLLMKSYEARRKHRNYSFIPEMYDKGHDYQFTKLEQMMEKCESIASSIYERVSRALPQCSKRDKSDESGKTEVFDDVLVKEMELVYSVSSFREKKVKDASEDEKSLNDYMIWISKYNRVKLEMIASITTLMSGLCKFRDTNRRDTCMIALTRYLLQLHNMNFFLPGFQFARCSCTDNGQCSGYVFKRMCHLACPSCKPYSEKFNVFINLYPVHELKVLLSILLFEDIVRDVIGKLIFLHAIYGDDLFYHGLVMMPTSSTEFNLSHEELLKNVFKPSRIMGVERMRERQRKKFDTNFDYIMTLDRVIRDS